MRPAVTWIKISLLVHVKPVFQYSMGDCDKRAVKTCLHVFRVRRMNAQATQTTSNYRPISGKVQVWHQIFALK